MVETINRFLSKFKSVNQIYVEAANQALDAMALPLANKLIEKVYYDDKNKDSEKNFDYYYLRAKYRYCLAKDNIDVSINVQKADYDIKDAESTLEKEESKRSYIENNNYGKCEILRVRILMLSENRDTNDITKYLTAVTSDIYPQEIRDEASNLKLEIKEIENEIHRQTK